MMACLLVMLPQQVFSIIITIRRAYDCVNVVPVSIFVLGKRLAGLVVEFDDEHRAMNAAVKNAIHSYTASPGEIGTKRKF